MVLVLGLEEMLQETSRELSLSSSKELRTATLEAMAAGMGLQHLMIGSVCEEVVSAIT